MKKKSYTYTTTTLLIGVTIAISCHFEVPKHWSKITLSKKLNLKKSSKIDQKISTNSLNQINQFHEFFFGPIPFFCNFKIGQKSIFELRKSLKLPKMQFREK